MSSRRGRTFGTALARLPKRRQNQADWAQVQSRRVVVAGPPHPKARTTAGMIGRLLSALVYDIEELDSSPGTPVVAAAHRVV